MTVDLELLHFAIELRIGGFVWRARPNGRVHPVQIRLARVGLGGTIQAQYGVLVG